MSLDIAEFGWIPGYGKLARPLYQLVKEAQRKGTIKLQWESDAIKAYKTLKKALLQTPALSFATGKQFNLFVTERSGGALGVLTQSRGKIQQPLAYLSNDQRALDFGDEWCIVNVSGKPPEELT